MYQRIVLSRLTNAVAIRFFKRTAILINETDELPAAIVDETGHLLSIAEAMETLFLNDPASGLTDVLEFADSRRDRLASSLHDMCTGYSRGPEESKYPFANALLRHFTVYGGVRDLIRCDYDTETTKLENFITDCREKPALRAALEALGLTAWIDAIAAANEEFETVHQQRTRNTADAKLPFKMLAKRKEGKECYDDLIDMLDGAGKMARGTGPFAKLAARMNELVDEMTEKEARSEAPATSA
ncbi:DUF6261 family protein [Flaviaesturariibacter aridisoli]|uniref:Uncharacterized protein n=1 Tax=Flaviaesturariibacter aridisoli TaxID=2545761 RepID=A0A4R4E751_9BACT|nr:DUF6261 family protein [Flaviaesturariibacter aridisoli]TCZ74743.1 hypothetical protein E0486_00115 [Flaviaesturariibacter aridisoli]